MGGRGSYSTSARMPRFRMATIPRSKIRDYLLSPKNPKELPKDSFPPLDE